MTRHPTDYPRVDPEQACPRCGGPTILRSVSEEYRGLRESEGRPTEFFGCMAFPECRGSLAIGESTSEARARAQAAIDEWRARSVATARARVANLEQELSRARGAVALLETGPEERKSKPDSAGTARRRR